MVAYLLVFYYLPILDHGLVLFTRLFFESSIDKTCPLPDNRRKPPIVTTDAGCFGEKYGSIVLLAENLSLMLKNSQGTLVLHFFKLTQG